MGEMRKGVETVKYVSLAPMELVKNGDDGYGHKDWRAAMLSGAVGRDKLDFI
jgi:hypothetical protein